MTTKHREVQAQAEGKWEPSIPGQFLISIWKAQSRAAYKDSVKASTELSNWYKEIAVSQRSKAIKEEFSALSFLASPSTKKGRAIVNFAMVRKHLAKAIALYRQSGDIASLERVSVYKAFSCWFQPTYKGFSPTENALEIYNSATLALDLIKEHQGQGQSSESEIGNRILECIALFCKLRILGFLVSNDKLPEAEMEIQKKRAGEIITVLESQGRSKILRGLLYIALGFKYLRWDANYEKALESYSKALQNLGRNSNFLGFAALAAWEAGLSVEGLSEKIEDAESHKSKILDSLSYYTKAAEYGEPTTWHLYKGVIHYNISAALAELASREEEQSKARDYLEQSISEGKKSLRYLSLWSPQESDFLGGSWLASAYHHLAALTKDNEERRKAVVVALKLANRALKVVSDPNIKLRFAEDNIGDVHYNTSKYYLMLLGKKTESKFSIQRLKKALLHAKKSLQYYREKNVLDRAIRARMLTGHLYLDLLKQNNREKFSRSTKSSSDKNSIFHYKKSADLCIQLGWWATQAECYERIANVYESLESYQESAKKYYEAVKAYEKLEKDKPKFAMTLTTSKMRIKSLADIQLAKASHFRGDYAQAADCYEQAATILKESARKPLQGDFFHAMSLLEKAEHDTNYDGLVSQGRARVRSYTRDSMKVLTDAKVSFDRICRTVTKRKKQFQNDDEIKELAKLSRFNSALSGAKITLEHARSCSSIGQGYKASSLLIKASELFQWLADWRNEVKLRNEMKSLSLFCKGLSYFELGNSLDLIRATKGNERQQHLYLKSSEAFREASNTSPSKNVRSLALGLAYLSSAFGAESEFEKTNGQQEGRLDVEVLLKIRERLGKASRCLREAGQSKFCLLASASKDLLDATVNIKAGENELEAVERMNYYSLANKYLRRAAQAYHKAGYVSRYNRVLSVIQSLESEEKVIFSLSDTLTDFKDQVLFYSTVMSSLSAQAESGTQLSETYEGAVVEISVEVPSDVVYVGNKITLEVSVLNLGREAAFLERIDGAIPDGFAFSSLMVESIDNSEPRVVSTREMVAEKIILNKARLEPNMGATYKLTFEAVQPGNSSWIPSLIYSDADREQKIAKASKTILRVEEREIRVEEMQRKVEDKKKELEQVAKLEGTESQNYRKILIEVRELEAKFEETNNRIRFEFQTATQELARISEELNSLDLKQTNTTQGSAARERSELRKRLLDEKKNLSAKLERLKSAYKTFL